jgi:small subunit ribosomal protein S3
MRGQYVSDIEIERNDKMIRLILKTSRPGIIIGRNGEGATSKKGKPICIEYAF